MRCALVLFGFALSACAPTPGPAAATRADVRAPAPPAAAVTSCTATPSTVYGEEPVAFALESSPPASIDVELFDQQGRSVMRAVTRAPASLPAPGLESGDFYLRMGQSRTSCVVTVNRELVRATSPAP